MVDIPAITLGSTVGSVIQFIMIMSIMGIVLNTKTTNGAGILPANVITHISGLLNVTNQTYILASGQNSLQVQMNQQTAQNANNINPGILQTLGGLAFIPAAFGLFIYSMWNLPGTMIEITQTLLSFDSPYVLLPFSVMALSAGLMAYYVIIFAMKLITPITKTEVEEV